MVSPFCFNSGLYSHTFYLSYKNGSVTRERIRDDVAEGQWDLFNQLLNSTPRGNFGNIGLYFDYPEITPHDVQGDFRFNKDNDKVIKFASKEVEARALIEGQFMAKRLHIEKMGFEINPSTRILVTGGASVNEPILQILSDVFNAPVFTQEETQNSAALGAAFRARYVHQGGEDTKTFEESVGKPTETHCITPHKDAKSVSIFLISYRNGFCVGQFSRFLMN